MVEEDHLVEVVVILMVEEEIIMVVEIMVLLAQGTMVVMVIKYHVNCVTSLDTLPKLAELCQTIKVLVQMPKKREATANI